MGRGGGKEKIVGCQPDSPFFATDGDLEHAKKPMVESALDQSPMEEDRRGSREQAIVPEPLMTDGDWQVPCIPKSPR